MFQLAYIFLCFEGVIFNMLYIVYKYIDTYLRFDESICEFVESLMGVCKLAGLLCLLVYFVLKEFSTLLIFLIYECI